MDEKCLAICSRSLLQLAILGVYLRRITYDSSTANISAFIEERNISFQNDISLKTMRLGVLPWEKLKTSWDSRQNRELGSASLGSGRAIADLFGLMFIAWTSQKAFMLHVPLDSNYWVGYCYWWSLALGELWLLGYPITTIPVWDKFGHKSGRLFHLSISS